MDFISDFLQAFGLVFDTVAPPAGDAATAADVANAFDAGSGAADVANAVTTPDVPMPAAEPVATPAEPPPAQAPAAEAAPQAQAPVAPAPAPPPNVAAPPTAQPAAPVEDHSIAAPGVIGGAAKWMKDLSPESQAILGKMLSGGASGAMAALAAKNKMEADREHEERLRQDTMRRGQVQAIGTNAYTPKTGIIDSRRVG